MYPDRDTFEQLYPARDALQHVINGGKCRDGRREKHCQFSLSGVNTPRVLNTNMKPQAKKVTIFKVIPEEKQQLVSSEGK